MGVVGTGGLTRVVAIGITHHGDGDGQRGIDTCCCNRYHSSWVWRAEGDWHVHVVVDILGLSTERDGQKETET